MAVLTHNETNAQTIETLDVDVQCNVMPWHAMRCDAYIPCKVSSAMYVRNTTIIRGNQILIRGSNKL